ncbi:M1 family metallopeptidase [Sphingomonas sp. So64.6b]|uniref:hypothetical protein n=1 Tax=Sphingomonas sp. So64.6b TaxID=2997354 RepID=UPI0016011F79|nr:hypothetical protein [Sphingomonas sp. So64.6b]QNA85307.1 M1 family metallopeptidase [Sphingomonas sp. So64.6b]
MKFVARLAVFGLCLVATAAQARPVYEVKASFDAAHKLSADVTITLPPGDMAKEIEFVLSNRFVLKPVRVAGPARVAIGKTARPMRGLTSIRVIPRGTPAQAVVVRLIYAGPIDSAGSDFFSPGLIELSLEAGWIPFRSDLTLDYAIDARIAGIPAGMDVVSQGKVSREKDGMVAIHRGYADVDLPIIAVPGLKHEDKDGLDFAAANPSDPLVALMKMHAAGAARFYADLLGPATYAPIRMTIVPREASGGYARAGFVVMPDFRKPGAPTPDYDESSPARFVAHEIFHAWRPGFSSDYANYWMSEAYAEFYGLRYVESRLGLAERQKMLDRKRPALATAGPLITPGKRPGNAAMYQKGAVMLFDLEQDIGRPALDTLLTGPDAPRTTAGLLKAMNAVAGAARTAAFEHALTH